MKKSLADGKGTFTYFLIWRILLFLTAFIAGIFIPFGNRFPYANTVLEPTGLPSWAWSFGNFDGVHYLRIAQDGYTSAYSQAFFPLYPFLIRIFNILPKNLSLDTGIYTDPSYFYTGFILSNAFFLAGLYIFFKLVKLDYSKRIASLSVLFLLVFPTSLYFGAIYSESLFLLLVVSCIYLARKKKYIFAACIAALASATRVTGVLLLPFLFIELLSNLKKSKNLTRLSTVKEMFKIAPAPAGLFLYMYYLKTNFGDAFMFLTSQPGFGAQRSASPFILLPQVLYRYLKMLLTVPVNTLPFFNILLELGFTLVPLALVVVYYKRIRASYLIFTLGVLLLPTLTGTLSSMPRYALMSFLLFPFIVKKWSRNVVFVMGVFVLLSLVLVSLFTRGYWIS